MFLFQICVVALYGICRCQATITLITLETIQNLQRTESRFMELVLMDGTCYTDATIRCVSIPNVEVDYQQYGVTPPFPVTEDLSHNILFTGNSLATVLQDTTSFMAFALRNYSGRVVGKSLHQVVQECVVQERYVQAFVRLMNVIESVGISMLWRFCEIVKIILTKSQTVEITYYYDMFDRLITDIENTFKFYFISTEPLRQIKAAIKVARINEKYVRGRKIFFINTCTEYSQRYGNMMNLVTAGNFNDFGLLTNGHRTTEELKHILSKAWLYFKKEDDIESVSGGRSHVLDQIKSEDIKYRQL